MLTKTPALNALTTLLSVPEVASAILHTSTMNFPFPARNAAVLARNAKTTNQTAQNARKTLDSSTVLVSARMGLHSTQQMNFVSSATVTAYDATILTRTHAHNALIMLSSMGQTANAPEDSIKSKRLKAPP